MKRPDAPSRDEWMDERVEAYVDGDLSPDEHSTFVSILDDNPFWQMQVRQADRIREGLNDFPEKPCPADVTEAIFEQTTRASAHAPLPWWKDVLRQMMQAWRALMTAHRRPAVDYAVGLALVGMAAFFIINPLDTNTSGTATNVSSTLNTAPIQAPYSNADVQRATQRAYSAFNHVFSAGQKASDTVQQQLKDAAAPAADRTTGAHATDSAPTDAPQTANAPNTADVNAAPHAMDRETADAETHVSSQSATPSPAPIGDQQ